MAFALPSLVLVQFSSSSIVISSDDGAWGPQPGKQRGSKAGEGKNPSQHTYPRLPFSAALAGMHAWQGASITELHP